jgi:hypothetical protein
MVWTNGQPRSEKKLKTNFKQKLLTTFEFNKFNENEPQCNLVIEALKT